MEVLQPTAERPIILNLPATVEAATPNIYADQIEYFCRNLPGRDRAVISLHTHNDRGTGVAAAELGLMAGADRIEGCLFGNGERTGNCCLVTLALNMYTQGIDPGLDFSDIDRRHRDRRVLQPDPGARAPSLWRRTGLHGLFRQPPGRDQERLRSAGHAQRRVVARALPADRSGRPRAQLRGRNPRQFAVRQGRLRLGSRAGPGPQAAQEAPGGFLQARPAGLADELGRELNAADIWQVFRESYFVKVPNRRFRLVDFEETRASDGTRLFAGTIEVDGKPQSVSGRGKGLISSVLTTLRQTFGLELEVLDYSEHALGAGTDARAATYLECATPDGRTVWGVGIDEDVATASVRAILSAANSAGREAS